MWYWNPVDCNEALPDIHDLSGCIQIDDETHPFKKGYIPDGKVWSNNEVNYPTLIDVPQPTHEALIEIANIEKNDHIAAAVSNIGIWQTELQLDIITEKNKASLLLWLAYINELKDIDTNLVPDIKWPVPPVV
jgi:Caudovirales tail fibre assembly protein.